MAYFASVLARIGNDWTGHEIDLEEYADLDAIVDEMRDLALEAEPVLLMVEEDDEWFGLVRVDGDRDPRLFVSDGRVMAASALASRLFQDAAVLAPDEEAEDEASLRPEGEPAGDPELLTDLGTPAATLLELCAEKGMLPSDVTTALCEKAGCLDCLEELRGA